MSRANPGVGLDKLWHGEAGWSEGVRQSGLRTVAALLLALIVFAVDTITALAGAVAVLYCLVLLVAAEGRARPAIRWSAGGCLMLATASFLENHSLSLDAAPDFRFLFSVAAILTTAFLLLRQAQTRQLYRVQARLLEITADAIVLRSCSGEVLLWNHGAEALYGWPRSAMRGAAHHDVLHSRFALPRPEIRIQLCAEGHWAGEVEQQRKDGSWITVSSRWQLMRNPAGESWAILETSTDITAHREAERKLQLSERRYRNIFETLAVAVFEYDFRPLKDMIEAARKRGLGDISEYCRSHPELIDQLRSSISIINANKTAMRLFEEENRESFVEKYRHFLPYSDEDFVRCIAAFDGEAAIFEASASAVDSSGKPLSLVIAMTFPADGDGLDCIQASVTDLTDIDRMANEIAGMRADLDQAMRAATIGEISATIAHEVNQPLAAVKTYVDAARRWLGHEPANVGEAKEALRDAIEAAGRAGEVVRKVRQLFNRGAPETLPVAIDTMISDTLRLAARDIVESATLLSLDLRADTAMVLGSRVLLQQSMLNLTTNALQAMGSVPEGERRLTISSEMKGRSVVVTVTDTGPGFPPGIVDNALDSFFSTRRGGMGLGLAVCRSTILSIGGEIKFGNRAGDAGAFVRLTLPIGE